ncbi:MAG: bifunctional N-acetylglucosamine-1-phosphate uridyltransferase/glucosamine-1-phosphate acetyltransferase [Acetivibrionales bacterium]|jgi:bifunctional UDP-N-acetylglucosamine pyrophosphorylase/glucosamine-1-phosphate N-acetyltransferase
MQELAALIIASDEGSRMNSFLPKYALKICGQAMLSYAIDAGLEAGSEKSVVLSVQNWDRIGELIPGDAVLIQNNEKSTDDKLTSKIREAFLEYITVLIIPGECPIISGNTLKAAYKYHLVKNNQITVLSNTEGSLSDICIMNTQLLIDEISSQEDDTNSLSIKNMIKKCYAVGYKVSGYRVSDSDELLQVNDKNQLSEAERIILNRIIKNHMDNGVIFHLPETCIIHNRVKIGKDTVIHPGTILEGDTAIGGNCHIGPYSRIEDSIVGDGVHFMNSVMIQSRIGNNTKVGPFAYIRPGSNIGEDIKVGDFVEIKNSNIGNNSKIPHLSYIGDADIGEHVNVGCGAVVVNYNGKEKNRTSVGDHAFVGCNVNLVSPVVINDYAYIAAGSTITDEVPEYALAIARSRQTIIADWVKRKRLDVK